LHCIILFIPSTLVCGNYTNVLKKGKNEDEGRFRKIGQHKLIDSRTALERVQDPVWYMGKYPPISQALTLTDSQWESITRLHEDVRNGLIHFVPMSLVMSVSEIQKPCKDILDVIEFLAFRSNQILYRDKMSQKERIAKAIKDLRESL
jgi:hypothetical protein